MALTNINNAPGQENNLIGYNVPSELYNIVLAWFERKNFTPTAAQVLASSLISTAIDNNGSQADVLELLKSYNNSSNAEMQELTAYLMNIARANSSFVGYESPSASNQVYSRLVI